MKTHTTLFEEYVYHINELAEHIQDNFIKGLITLEQYVILTGKIFSALSYAVKKDFTKSRKVILAIFRKLHKIYKT